MNRFIWTLGLAIIGQVGYQFGQKSIPRTASPFVVLAAAYAIAFVLCLVSIPLTGPTPTMQDMRASIGWPTWTVALSIYGVEIGYLLAYRSGWTINLAFAVASTVTVVMLAVIGATLLGNSISPRRLLGLGLACASLWLIVVDGGTS
jgi:multidrug transporter EmrE-like cation transporter